MGDCDDLVAWDDLLAEVDKIRTEHHEWDKRRVQETETLMFVAAELREQLDAAQQQIAALTAERDEARAMLPRERTER